MNWYLEALKKYAVFSGRARRREYWLFSLFNLIISLVLTFIGAAAGLGDTDAGYGLLGSLYTLGVLIPGVAVSVRRLHDIGRSGWWLFISLVPFIGAIVLLVFALLDSQPGPNQYGPNPKHTWA